MNQEPVARIINVRVYSTRWYCYEPSASNRIRKSNPLVLDNFPETECTINCYFGEIPESVINLKYSIDGFGLKRKKEMISRYSQNKPKEFPLEDCIAEIKSISDYLQKYAWATTIVIEKRINPRELKMIDDNGKISFYESHRYFRKSYDESAYSGLFDKIILSFLTEMNPILFDELLISETALLIDGEIVVAFPKTMAQPAVGFQYCEGKTINLKKISSSIKKSTSPSTNWLGNIAHWRISMLTEKDPWKKFYLGFICLEMLTHKTYKKIYNQNEFDVIMRHGQLFNKAVKMPFADFIPKETECRKLPLMMKFSLIAGVLNPKNCLEDISDFKDCKNFRDKMSHEGVHERDKLPLDKLDSLLDFYLGAILKQI